MFLFKNDEDKTEYFFEQLWVNGLVQWPNNGSLVVLKFGFCPSNFPVLYFNHFYHNRRQVKRSGWVAYQTFLFICLLGSIVVSNCHLICLLEFPSVISIWQSFITRRTERIIKDYQNSFFHYVYFRWCNMLLPQKRFRPLSNTLTTLMSPRSDKVLDHSWL